ncbi:hypothetical protein SCG7109_AI_00070 [Chlamydiales bacterium SCGC AG-110-M15]|nr:hypothetical protein SCG7109_AI_00070 [Chlamydiales bacterium SCGC AG-110-M15]
MLYFRRLRSSLGAPKGGGLGNMLANIQYFYLANVAEGPNWNNVI